MPLAVVYYMRFVVKKIVNSLFKTRNLITFVPDKITES